MKTKAKTTIITITLILIFISIFLKPSKNTDAGRNERNEKKEVTLTSTTITDTYYRISIFNDKVALFNGNSKTPYKIYDTYASSLPEEEQKKLVDGIIVFSSEDLIKLIEIYTS